MESDEDFKLISKNIRNEVMKEYEVEKIARENRLKSALDNATVIEKLSFITNSSTYSGVVNFIFVLLSLVVFFGLVAFFQNDQLAIILLSVFFLLYMSSYYISLHFVEKHGFCEKDLFGENHLKYVFITSIVKPVPLGTGYKKGKIYLTNKFF